MQFNEVRFIKLHFLCLNPEEKGVRIADFWIP